MDKDWRDEDKINSYSKTETQTEDNELVDNTGKTDTDTVADNSSEAVTNSETRTDTRTEEEKREEDIKKAAAAPLADSMTFHIRGSDARAIYDRLEITPDRQRSSVRRGPNIECDSNTSGILAGVVDKLNKDAKYSCTFTVQLVAKDGLQIGQHLNLPYPGNQDNKKGKGTSKAYPAVAGHVDQVYIKSGVDDIMIFLNSLDADVKLKNLNDPAASRHIMEKLDVTAIKGMKDADEKKEENQIAATVKQSGSLKCYETIDQTPKETRCFIQIDVKRGIGTDMRF